MTITEVRLKPDTTAGGFLSQGHLPTLVAALLYFDVSFMTWVLLGPLAPFLRETLALSPTQQGLVTAIPLLGGSLCRPLLGLLGDRIGGRRAGLFGLAFTCVPLVLGWQFAATVTHFYAIGLLLGVAGASFAVALPLAGRWYPPQYQGLAMGIAGAGNSGTLLATLFAPRIAAAYGWPSAFALALVPIGVVFVLFALLAKDSPARTPRLSLRDYGRLVREPDALALSALYSLTFGGFVGFASYLTTFFQEQYQMPPVAAGDFTTAVVVAGSLLRPVGGWLSDRLGGYRLLVLLLGGFTLCLAAVAAGPSAYGALAILFVGMGMLGMGNGAVFQLVPQRFAGDLGVATGLVGAAGGVGGFLLPTLLGAVREATGGYAVGLALCALAFAAGTMALLELGVRWSRRWTATAVTQSGIYAYRGGWRAAGESA